MNHQNRFPNPLDGDGDSSNVVLPAVVVAGCVVDVGVVLMKHFRLRMK